MIEVIQATSPQINDVRRLLMEYITWVKTLHTVEDVPAFEGFADELRGLPGDYAPPQGRLLLALSDGQAVGCVGLRPVEAGICELKRMYVKPAHRGQGIGWHLGETLVKEARQIGYTKIILDSHHSMHSAHVIYRALGFKDIAAPPDAPEFVRREAIFMEMSLA